MLEPELAMAFFSDLTFLYIFVFCSVWSEVTGMLTEEGKKKATRGRSASSQDHFFK